MSHSTFQDHTEPTAHVLPFSAVSDGDFAKIGGKARSLATMTRMGVPVPGGFVLTSDAYRLALERSAVAQQIRALLKSCTDAKAIDIADCSKELIALARLIAIPGSVAAQIETAYRQLAASDSERPAVAVRSSALCEDGAQTSFAGEYDTYLDIQGEQALLEHIQFCWVSLFSPRALSYAREAGVDLAGIEMAVVVQLMTRARSSGVLFTLSPKTGDRSRIFIESAWGLGLSVVGGEVTPDQFSIDKISGRILERAIASKTVCYRRGNSAEPVPAGLQGEPSLSDEEAIALAELGRELEHRFGHPVDIEWSIDQAEPGKIAILQCRAETAWSQRKTGGSGSANTQRLSSALLDLASQLRFRS